ncbi:ADP-ribosylation factor [Mycena albidolilacea]|uniref:ADP-ribosylation factor n=1 Tax=Mycena albidolilacea TaxID=1033008 RepID=A0AAD6ZCN8_9AGAR|nr:ADP-ribosylation factor [Mycena albidolilacea]
MNNIISRLVERFYSGGTGYSALILGLDASGKTTLLYRMKLGEVVQTIPTIGFNVESVRLKARGRTDRVLNLTCWDVGGCGRGIFSSFIAQYASHVDAIIWLVDSNDRQRLEDSITEFSTITGLVAADTTIPPKERPVLILATKQDLPKAMSLDEIRKKVAPATAGMSAFSVGVTLTQSLTDGALPDAFGWLLMALESVRKGNAPPSQISKLVPARTMHVLEERLPSWLLRAEGDSSAAEFLRQFETINLPAWDHYTHIRIAYLMLTQYGRQKGKDKIFQGIERYIEQSAQTGGRTFHVTMTYFWVQIVHFGIRSTPQLVRSESDAGSDLGSRSLDDPDDSPELDDFPRFLLLNPYVADGNLWAEYYSKDVMMSVEAKQGPVLPDIKPLPNLVVRDAIFIAQLG